MIHSINNYRKLHMQSPFVQYIQKTHGYTDEYLFYSTKYSSGTFSIQNPSHSFINCQYISNYPHFIVPDEVCTNEAKSFIGHYNIYKNKFIIRYGDTHPHKPVPKLGQVRNILIAHAFSKMIGNNANLYYGFGDISIKSLQSLILETNLQVSAEDLFIRLVNNRLSSTEKNLLYQYNTKGIDAIRVFFNKLKISCPHYVIESSLYSNQLLYQTIKKNPMYAEYLKTNGEVSYILQEIMFIESLINFDSDVMVNVIGANQSDHIVKVLSLVRSSQVHGDIRFLSYGMCDNASEVDLNKWSDFLERFIEKQELKINKKILLPIDFLRFITIAFPMDSTIDFSHLEKYVHGARLFCKVAESLLTSSSDSNIENNHHTLCRMAMVHYTLNKSIESGNISMFYNYLISLCVRKKSGSYFIRFTPILKEFILEGFRRIGFDSLEDNYG